MQADMTWQKAKLLELKEVKVFDITRDCLKRNATLAIDAIGFEDRNKLKKIGGVLNILRWLLVLLMEKLF